MQEKLDIIQIKKNNENKWMLITYMYNIEILDH